MLTDEQLELRRLQNELQSINEGKFRPKVREVIRDQLDVIKAPEDISTAEVAKKRKLPVIGGGFVFYSPTKAPYLAEINDAMDDPHKRIVVVKGPARSGKTTAAENFLLKIALYGPSRMVLWYMHSEPDLRRYVAERVDFFLQEHDEVAEKVGKGKDAKKSWNLKTIDGQVWEWLPANKGTTRGRSGAVVVCDEIDAMRPEIGNAIVTLIKNRQREYGTLAKAFFCSHPDRGPLFGIDKLLMDTDQRIRIWTCCYCGHLMSPAVEAPAGRRVTWNLGTLMEKRDELSREDLIEHCAAHVRLICPHCKGDISNEQRLELDSTGVWMAKGMEINEREEIVGEPDPSEGAGFIIHAFMAPFVNLAELAKEFVSAYLEKLSTGNDADLKEVTVKSLGETYRDDEAGSKVRPWKETRAKHLDTGYKLISVPRGVDFLTGFVDVQGDRFESAVWGWSRSLECWLIDRYSLKQKLGLRDINPGERIEDWDVIEHVLRQTYPLVDGSGRHLKIAKLAVDTGGVPGVTENARVWAANLFAAGKCEPWRLMLSKGDAHMKGELYGHVNKIKEDKGGRPLPVTVLERVVNVTEVKKMIARRMDVDEPGPLFIHLPKDVEDKHVRELVSETLVNGQWIQSGHNETWDSLVMAEVARALLAPQNRAIDWVNDPPSWARPFKPKSRSETEDDNQPDEADFFSRLSKMNKGK